MLFLTGEKVSLLKKKAALLSQHYLQTADRRCPFVLFYCVHTTTSTTLRLKMWRVKLKRKSELCLCLSLV